MRLCRPLISPGDPYLAFAKQAGAVPADATKQSHGPERELFKQCVLAVAYGMEAKSLALRIGQPEIVARDAIAGASRNLPQVLDMVRFDCRSRDVGVPAGDGVRLAAPGWR